MSGLGQELIYYQDSGELGFPDGRVFRGYSGAPGYVNNPDAEARVDEGPIPAGVWILDNAAHNSQQTGRYVIGLQPEGGRHPTGRTNMQIHGDRVDENAPPLSGSQGCIVLTRAQREAIMGSGIRRLRVVRSREE